MTGSLSNYNNASYTRPTVASLNRTHSILSLRHRSTSNSNTLIPSKSNNQLELPEENANEEMEIVIMKGEISNIATSTPRRGVGLENTSLTKKRVHSSALAQKHTIIGNAGGDQILQARKVRAKRDLNKARDGHISPDKVNSIQEMATCGSSAGKDLLTGRDRWR